MQISTLNGHNKSFETCKLWEWKLADKTLLLRTYKEKKLPRPDATDQEYHLT